MNLKFVLVCSIIIGSCYSEKGDLEESESNQSYGYGYGTKVSDQYGESTVYVHGFGTTNDDDDYHNEIPNYIVPAYEKPAYYSPPTYAPPPPPVYHPKPYGPPAYYPKPYLQGYGYGQIDAYGVARHGYGFQKRYGYDAPVYDAYAPAPTPLPAPAPAPFAHGAVGVPPPAGPAFGAPLEATPAPHTPSLGHSFGYGFSQF